MNDITKKDNIENIIDKVVQLSIAKIMGQGILNIIDGKSVSYLFEYDPKNRL